LSARTTQPAEAAPWPPEGAKEIDPDEILSQLEALGIELGGAFDLITAAWQKGEQRFIEAALTPEQKESAAAFNLHPALFESVFLASAAEGDEVALPTRFTGLSLQGAGPTSLRASMRVKDGKLTELIARDEFGEEVCAAESAELGPLDREAIKAAAKIPAAEALFTVQWQLAEAKPAAEPAELAVIGGEQPDFSDIAALTHAVDAGAPVPDFALLDLSAPSELATPPEPSALPESAAAAAGAALAAIQSWLAAEPLYQSTLVLLTSRAINAEPGEHLNLENSAIWGLARSAQSEYPGRLILLDADSAPASSQLIEAALASGESQIALRDGKILVPRLVALAGEEDVAGEADEPAPAFTPGKSVLITGA
ncbi:SpnB-like Rossmann fold domain-containing protein, partial [Aquabacterium sp.]|uniref:SpnB-like Rossmann fold domain-containing protein n=1 Tax=Aquabacterium sp. TaxID=1872578 RepID=UPI003D6D0840